MITRVNGKSASRRVYNYLTRDKLEAGMRRAEKRGVTNFWLYEGPELIGERHYGIDVTDTPCAGCNKNMTTDEYDKRHTPGTEEFHEACCPDCKEEVTQ